MNRNRKEHISPLVRKAFLRLLPIQIIEIIVFSVNTFVDSLITSRFLGTDSMAAMGFFSPVATIIGITDVVIFGTQILCGRHIGSGEGKKVVSLFSTGMVFVGAVSLMMSTGCILLSAPVSALLGAKGQIALLLRDYMIGYAPGIIAQVLTGMMLMFLPYNNDLRRAWLGIGVMICSNTVLDLLFVSVWNIGILGMGLATSCSYLISCVVMLPGFLPGKRRAVFFHWGDFCFGQMWEVILLGMPSLMMVAGGTARGHIMNLLLMNHVGSAAVAAMTVQSMVCAIIGSIPMGCANAFLTMGSIHYGEEDRRSLVDLMRFSLCFGAAIAALTAAALMLFSGSIASWFYVPGEEAWGITRRMLLLFPVFLVLNTISLLLLKCWQLQQKTRLVNALSVMEPLIMALFAVSLVRVIGADAVWISFPLSSLVCLLIMAVSAARCAGKPTLALPDWMKLDRGFGASEEESRSFFVQSMQEVIQVSERVIDFCKSRKVDGRRSFFAGLCVEEMAGNIVTHGFRSGEKHHVEIRLVVRDTLIVCMRDDCRAFDPKARLDQFTPEDVTRNLGIRMVAETAEEMNYQCTAGINTLLLRL